MAAIVRLPIRSNATLRPSRAASLPGPTRPSVIAATVGANTPPSTAMTMSAASTTGTVGFHAIANAHPDRAPTPPIRSARFECVASMIKPIGVCMVIPMRPLTVRTAPIVAWSQPASVSRNTLTYGPSPPRTSASRKFSQSSDAPCGMGGAHLVELQLASAGYRECCQVFPRGGVLLSFPPRQRQLGERSTPTA